MNILYSIDEWKKDYSRYLWVSILSLLDNNKNEDVQIYILSKYIEESNKKDLIRIVESFWKKIFFSDEKCDIVPEKFENVLCLKWWWPLATYYRLFFSNCFDIKDRLLYLDCDTIINKNLSEFYNLDFEWNVFIWNPDIEVTCYDRKKKYWIKKYINAWVTLININLFKEIDLYRGIINVNQKYWPVDYVDQDYINLIFNDKIKLNNRLQCIIYYKWMKYKYNNYLVLHTVEKPNHKWMTTKYIEALFDKYLLRTKWKSYVWYKEKLSRKTYFFNLYILIGRFFERLSLYLFWDWLGYYTNKLFIIWKDFFGKTYKLIEKNFY